MAASFPMYDWPEIRGATDAWWAGIAAALRIQGVSNVPVALRHDDDCPEHWSAPDLVLSQTCGYPLMHRFAGRLRVVATPHYNAEGCEGAEYCSFILARSATGIECLDALRGRTAAYNAEDSQSGYSALRAVFAPLARGGCFFGSTVCSGSHLGSMQMVASGEADVCAVDAVVWALVRRHRPELGALLTDLGRSPSAPALPYVTSSHASDNDVQRLRAGLRAAFADPALTDVRGQLLLRGLSVPRPRFYQRILQIEQASIAQGYDVLR